MFLGTMILTAETSERMKDKCEVDRHVAVFATHAILNLCMFIAEATGWHASLSARRDLSELSPLKKQMLVNI